MLRLILNKKILAISLCLLSTLVSADDIGDIVEHSGSSGIVRDGTKEVILGAVDEDIFFKDSIETATGRMKIVFVDDTKLSLTEHTEVVIDEYYFDPDPSKSKMTMKFISGTARFTTGRLGLVPKENIVIQTPTATIGVRGTDFTTSVDELGRSLVILLPDAVCGSMEICEPSGEITVTNEGGTVVLTEAFQATMVSSISTPPVQPVKLDNIMNLDTIDNMFIVSPPEKIVDAQAEESTGSSSTSNGILDFNDLDIDYLKEDWDDEENLEFTELDMDLLDVDFLQDVLVTIEEVNILKRSTKSAENASGGDITGTQIGFDKETQYNTIIDQSMGQIWFYRNVNGVIDIRVPIESGTRIESENEGKTNLILVNDGESVVIIIKQSGG
jgi:hypothetical protein|tara:strand:+ start:9478 stop:10635 length:1158 start_codon:yes stop_codon:yes gene_type:complete